MGQSTVLFVDEIHRFSKAQQDALLPLVEICIISKVFKNVLACVDLSHCSHVLSHCGMLCHKGTFFQRLKLRYVYVSFMDEVHRCSRAQQDALLPLVEILIIS